MTLRGKKIFIVDDTSSIRAFLRIALQSMNAELHEAKNASEALSISAEVMPDVVILDLGLPDRDGLEILPIIKETTGAKIIILSVGKDTDTQLYALRNGASAYLTKPFLMDQLVMIIQNQFLLDKI